MFILFPNHFYLKLIMGSMTSSIQGYRALRALFKFISVWNVSVLGNLFVPFNFWRKPSPLFLITLLFLTPFNKRVHKIELRHILLFLWSLRILKLELIRDFWEVVIVICVVIIVFRTSYGLVVAEPSCQRSIAFWLVRLIRAEIVRFCLILIFIVVVGWDRWF